MLLLLLPYSPLLLLSLLGVDEDGVEAGEEIVLEESRRGLVLDGLGQQRTTVFQRPVHPVGRSQVALRSGGGGGRGGGYDG